MSYSNDSLTKRASSIQWRQALRAAPYILLIALALRYVIFYALAPRAALIATSQDDAYYYFEIAKNVAAGSGVTFDGIHATNGFHPLWLFTLVPIYLLPVSDVLALRFIGLLTVVLLTAGSLLGLRHIVREHSWFSAATVTVALLYLLDNYYQMNMELSVVYPLGVAVLYVFASRNVLAFDRTPDRTLVGAGCLLALFMIARLDAVLFVAIAGLYTLVRHRGRLADRQFWRSVFLLFGPAFVLGCVYAGVNLLVFGHLSPVSSQAKSLGEAGLNTQIINQIVPVLDGVSLPRLLSTAVRTGAVVLSIGAVVASLTGFATRSRTGSVAFLASAFFLVQLVYYGVFSDAPLFAWYFYMVPVVFIFVLPNVLDPIVEHLPSAIPAGAGSVLLVGGLAFLLVMVPTTPTATEAEGLFMYMNAQSAESVNDELPDGLYAMGDQAGAYAYFSESSVVQLEGLTNNYQVLGYVENDSLGRYLSNQNVDYLVDRSPSSAESFSPPSPQYIADSPVSVDPECVAYSTDDITVWSWSCVANESG